MNKSKRLFEATIAVVCAVAGVNESVAQQQADTLGAMFSLGLPLVDLRYRLETVKQDNELKDATASTLRTRLGFETAEYHGFNVLVEGENVVSVGSDDYDSTTNGNTGFSAVLDPETTEFNQAYLGIRWRDTLIRAGRQRMKWDNERFLGNVGFRQNEQTYDALSIMNTTFPGSRLQYTYMPRVHRFFGDDNPRGDVEMNSHFFNYSYTQLNANQLSAYAYLLEIEAEGLQQNSTKTFGLRYTGSLDVQRLKLLFAVEYANQSDYAEGASTNDADYAMLELGLKFPSEWIAQLGIEYLGGDGVYGFQTQLATAHAFNGWADVFAASTPPDGLIDSYVTLSAPIAGVKLTITWHDFASDNNSIDYGTELDAKISKKFGEHYELGLEYATYSADEFAVDTDKFWVWFAVAF